MNLLRTVGCRESTAKMPAIFNIWHGNDRDEN